MRMERQNGGVRVLDGKTALVTGAGRRVGKAIALALAEAGANVVVHYNLSKRGAQSAIEEARAHGVKAARIRADLSDPEQVERIFAETKDHMGGPDILVNSAALFERIPFGDLDLRAWQRTLALNLTAPFLCCKAALPEMRARGGGCIVNICDIGGLVAWKGFSHYNVSKAGLIMLTRALAVELAPEIRVNAVAPGTVLFPDDYDADARARIESRIPMGRVGTPEDVAAAVLFFVSGPAYVTGQVLAVDGGRSARDITGG